MQSMLHTFLADDDIFLGSSLDDRYHQDLLQACDDLGSVPALPVDFAVEPMLKEELYSTTHDVYPPQEDFSQTMLPACLNEFLSEPFSSDSLPEVPSPTQACGAPYHGTSPVPSLPQSPSPYQSEASSPMASIPPSPSPTPFGCSAPPSKKRKACKSADVGEVLAGFSSLPALPPRKRKVGEVMEDEEKRQRNKVAAQKYRLKLRAGAVLTEVRVQQLETEQEELLRAVMEERRKVAELLQQIQARGVNP